MSVMTWCVNRWRDLLAILIDRPEHRHSAALIHVLHTAFIIGITAVLAWQTPNLLAPGTVFHTSHEFVERYWCGLLFAAAYIFIRTLVFAIGLFAIRDSSEFPDTLDGGVNQCGVGNSAEPLLV